MLGGGAYSTTTQSVVENIDETPQIKYYSYAPNTIKVENGSDVINFSYKPSNKLNYAQQPLNTNVSEQSTIHTQAGASSIDLKYVKNIDARAGQTIAYEYVFGNAMNRTTAVNLKSIGDITDSGVSVSYFWRNTPLTQGESVTNSPAKFTCQEMTNKDDTIYLYVIVSSESADIPADFTTDIVWYYGIPYDMPVYNNISGTNTSVKLVKGQAITEDILPTEDELLTDIGKVDAGYYFDAWFTDSKYTQVANLNDIKASKPLYPRFHNIPIGVTTYMTYDSATESYTVSSGCASLVTTTNTKLIIPTYYNDGTNGKALVKSVSETAFYECSSLTSITISSSVTSIGYEAFRSCTSLTSITLPSSVTSIGSSAFQGCSSLTSVTIPVSVTSIGSSAFYECSSLTSTTIPSSVTSIGEYAFYGCGSLTSIVVEAGNPVYDSRNNCNAIIETATNTLIQGSNTTIIPNTVTSIGSYAFGYCNQLTSITIPNSVTSISDYTFYSCSSLTSITIPDSVTTIGEGAFRSCSSLTGIIIPSSVTSIGSYAFGFCNQLTSITIPNSVTTIGDGAFRSCSSLTSITLPSSLTSISKHIFYECSNLTSITIPNSVTSIGDWAFCLCSSLTSMTIPNSVTSIGYYAFSNCSNLTSITIPNSVTSIGNYAFRYCSSLSSITFEDTSTWYRTDNSTDWNNKQNGTETSVTDATQNATYFKYTYYVYYWYKL